MSSPVRILHYYPDFGAQGGIERHIEQLTLALKARGRYEPLVACTADGPFLRRLQSQGVRVCGIQTAALFAKPNYRALDLASMTQLARLIRREKPQAAHVHIGQIENLLFKALGLPTAYTFHGYEKLYSLEQTPHAVTRAFKRAIRAGFRFSVDRLDAFCVVSRAERDRLAREGYLSSADRGMILPNGVTLEAFYPPNLAARVAAFESRWQIPANARCISFLNRLDANKNPLAYVRLAERLCAAFAEQPLFFPLAGEGPLSEEVARAVQASPFADRFRLLGFCDDVPALLARSAATVFTPLMEGFGLGALEAMAAGSPPVVYAVGGLPEIIGDAPDLSALLVAPDDEAALFDAVCQILALSGAEIEALRARLQQRAEGFSLSVMVDRVEALYDSILRRDRSVCP
ncbi:MAG: glycosyltransferase [Vampirovibrionales bacterium]|nr:glycosyltransferase [Vampirovibrionales bacterium]